MTELKPLILLSWLATGGAERVTVSFARRLRSMGMEALVCTVTSRYDGALAAELADAGVSRSDLGARRLTDPRSLARLLQLLDRQRPHLVHAHGQDASIIAAAARSLSGVPLAITRHVLDEPAATWRERVRSRATLAALRRADVVVAVSQAVAERLTTPGRIASESVHVIQNGIELERFNGDHAAARQAHRASVSPDTDGPLVLVPALLREGKGHEVLLRAVPAIRSRVPSARLLFAGGGDRELVLRAEARGLEHAVHFLGPRSDMPELLAACDLVVLPSLWEALPTALIEAAAAGRPVVATRIGGVPEVVVDGETGLLVPPNDPAALAHAIVTLLLDSERARAFGAAGRRLARQRFSIEAQVARTLDLWHSLVDGRRPRRVVR